MVPEENKTFYSIKCKLKFIASPKAVAELERIALVAHKIFKRTSLLLKAYCLNAPDFTLSLVRHCMSFVSTRDASGRKPKRDLLGDDISRFWKEKLSRAYPERLEGRGLSVLKLLLSCLTVSWWTQNPILKPDWPSL